MSIRLILPSLSFFFFYFFCACVASKMVVFFFYNFSFLCCKFITFFSSLSSFCFFLPNLFVHIRSPVYNSLCLFLVFFFFSFPQCVAANVNLIYETLILLFLGFIFLQLFLFHLILNYENDLWIFFWVMFTYKDIKGFISQLHLLALGFHYWIQHCIMYS